MLNAPWTYLLKLLKDYNKFPHVSTYVKRGQIIRGQGQAIEAEAKFSVSKPTPRQKSEAES